MRWLADEAYPAAEKIRVVLVIRGVSVIAAALLAIGADTIMKEVLIEGVCEQVDDMIPPGTQWWCHGGTSFWGW